MSDDQATIIYNDLTNFYNLNCKVSNSSGIYAIAQMMHDQLQELDITGAEKGQLISQLLANFIEFNSENLALFNGLMRVSLGDTPQTLH